MRKYVISIIGLVAIVATIGLVTSGYGSGNVECERETFIDEDGDGICDNWVDVDSDGVNDNRLMDGSGNQFRNGGEQCKRFGANYGFGQSDKGTKDGNRFGPANGNCQLE